MMIAAEALYREVRGTVQCRGWLERHYILVLDSNLPCNEYKKSPDS
jgi:hypothetical protein